jgi:hypothetical protein
MMSMKTGGTLPRVRFLTRETFRVLSQEDLGLANGGGLNTQGTSTSASNGTGGGSQTTSSGG